MGAIAGLVAAILTFPCQPKTTLPSPSPLSTPSPPPPDSCAAALAVPGGGPQSGAAITICEVIANPPGSDPDNEKITLCNAGPEPAKIGKWRLRDNHGEYSIPEGATIPPGGRWEIFGTTFNPDGIPELGSR